MVPPGDPSGGPPSHLTHRVGGAISGLAVLLSWLVLLPAPQQGQQGGPCETQLTGRWVGQHRQQILLLEFYGDTMLVVDDRYPLSFRVTADSLFATGDTTITARYWFSYGTGTACRLLLQTPDGSEITMTYQEPLARPLTGRWVGDLGPPLNGTAEMRIAAGKTARWHMLPSGPWTDGEWERDTRLITFTWATDTIPWIGHYDPEGNAILFDHTVPGSGTAIFRRIFR